MDYGDSYLPSELNAAYLWAQLLHAEDILNDRIGTWSFYNEELQCIAEDGKVELPYVLEDCKHNGHIFYLKLENIEERTKFIDYMRKHGIYCVFHYVPLHSAPAGRKFGRFAGEDIYTTKESERLVRLPLYYGLSEKDREEVVARIKAYFCK